RPDRPRPALWRTAPSSPAPRRCAIFRAVRRLLRGQIMNATRAPRQLRPRSSALLVSLIGAIGIALSNCGGDSGANGANGPPSDGGKDGGTVSLDATTSSGGDAHTAVPDGGD